MNRNKYKYFDSLSIKETKCNVYGYYWWYDDPDYTKYNKYLEYEYYIDSKYAEYYYDWLYDPSRLRDIKIDELLSDTPFGNLSLKIPKSLFK